MGYFGAILVHPMRCRNLASNLRLNFYNINMRLCYKQKKSRKKLEMIPIFREDLSVPGQVAQRAVVLRNVGDSCEAKVLS